MLRVSTGAQIERRRQEQPRAAPRRITAVHVAEIRKYAAVPEMCILCCCCCCCCAFQSAHRGTWINNAQEQYPSQYRFIFDCGFCCGGCHGRTQNTKKKGQRGHRGPPQVGSLHYLFAPGTKRCQHEERYFSTANSPQSGSNPAASRFSCCHVLGATLETPLMPGAFAETSFGRGQSTAPNT